MTIIGMGPEAMSEVLFAPWVGAKYGKEGFKGLRVLVVSESHYGPEKSQRPTVTPETIKALAQGKKHPEIEKRLKLHAHYGKILASMHGKGGTGGITMPARREFWDCVAYYNFLQVMLPKSRVAPPAAAWAAADRAFVHVLTVLKPELVLVYSKRVGQRLAKAGLGVSMAWVHHPSSGFTYRGCNPRIALALETAIQRRAQVAQPVAETAWHSDFRLWCEVSSDAEPAHGWNLTADRREEVRARWAFDMQQARSRISEYLRSRNALS